MMPGGMELAEGGGATGQASAEDRDPGAYAIDSSDLTKKYGNHSRTSSAWALT
jgi:hypothetical protein